MSRRRKNKRANPLTDPMGQLGQLGKAIKKVRRIGLPRIRRTKLGGMPGIEPHELAHYPSDGSKAVITCVDYCPDQIQSQVVENLDEFIQGRRPDWSAVRWINVDGLGDIKIIQALAQKYQLHPLAIEDVLHVQQRPKVDLFEGDNNKHSRVFVVARMAMLVEGRVRSEQVSMFLGHNTVITFQEAQGDVWNPVRDRLSKTGTRVRLNDASFLLYSFIDAIVDQFFPILEHYGNELENLEDTIFEHPDPRNMHDIHELKRQLLLIRRDVWPMREMVQTLQREPHECMAENTRMYLRDVYDHAVQIIDLLETYREVASGLTEMYMSSMSQRLNEVMKVLTIMGTIFIPMTFVAGVYGMNFTHMPELDWKYSYPIFWVVCLAISGSMIGWFRRRHWL